jgi:hypothetical protein
VTTMRLLVPTLFVSCAIVHLRADTAILHDGSSYSGRLISTPEDQLSFKNEQGVQFTFPRHDLQSIVFTQSNDVITLRNGRTYSGQYAGGSDISFQDSEGVHYQFPVSVLSSVVFSAAPGAANRAANFGRSKMSPGAKLIPLGTELSIRIDERIDSKDSSPGQLFSATVNQDVFDAAGAIAIPTMSPAKVVVRNVTNTSGTPELGLQLFSVEVNGKHYRVASSDIEETSRSNVGANRRTAEYGAGGAAMGALLGAVFGGGRGAAIGTLSGGAGGLFTQFVTRGREVKVPAETVLLFRLNRQLVLHPGPSSAGSTAQY